jgi:hypothetical protein
VACGTASAADRNRCRAVVYESEKTLQVFNVVVVMVVRGNCDSGGGFQSHGISTSVQSPPAPPLRDAGKYHRTPTANTTTRIVPIVPAVAAVVVVLRSIIFFFWVQLRYRCVQQKGNACCATVPSALAQLCQMRIQAESRSVFSPASTSGWLTSHRVTWSSNNNMSPSLCLPFRV